MKEPNFDVGELKARITWQERDGVIPVQLSREGYLSPKIQLEIIKLKEGKHLTFSGFDSNSPMEEAQTYRRALVQFARAFRGPGVVASSVIPAGETESGKVEVNLGWQILPLLTNNGS